MKDADDTHDDGRAATRAASGPEASAETVVDEQLVPVWLAALVLVLLLAVVGVGGFILRDVLSREDDPVSAVELGVIRAEQMVESSPDDPDARLELGFSYQQAGRYEEALAEYDTVLELRPDDTAALYNSGMILVELERDDEAEETLWDVLEIEPQHMLAAKALGDFYAEREEYRSLLVAVEPVVEANESSADLQYLMGLAYEHTGHPDWARARYERALSYYPDMPEARAGLERLGVTP